MTEENLVTGETAVETPKDDYEVHSETVLKEQEKEAPEAPKEEAKAPEEEGSEKVKKPTGYVKKLNQKDAEIAQLRAQLEARSAAEAKPAEGDKEPSENDYESVLDYIKAHAKWEAKQELNAFKTEQAQTAQKQIQEAEFTKLVETNDVREAEFIKTNPDYFDVIDPLIEQGLVSEELATAVMKFEASPAIAYHLAKNPSDFLMIQNLKGAQLDYALNIINNAVSTPQAAAARQTRAAAPISPVKPTASTGKNIDEMDYEDFKKAREAQLRR